MKESKKSKYKSLTSRSLAKSIAEIASAMKAEDIVLMDMRKVANFCDFFVIANGTSHRHVKSIAENIEEQLDVGKVYARRKQGYKEGRWVLIDFGNVVAHIFDADTRNFYGLEYLWEEAQLIKHKQKKI